ncbi:hypothetical protein [Actinacidiphila bryophytorum]|uniref:hypothetical protein n=1 Tax=Actinacidiphila bryophytorum TaxID=1436133 RepID=UPI0019620658|nr:hypothetical protein [Actinacidiphila bryophytorum]MBM9436939.1 hypothetical protein [Actinacidiphila bryophytorum]MBN6545133.1 hypothetical protein [Actinacidiphila bryophytorum]
MLASPGSGVRELQEELGISEEEVRSALDTLSELVLVIPSQEGDAGLQAISPDLGMEVLLSRQQAELAEQQRRLEVSRRLPGQRQEQPADDALRRVADGAGSAGADVAHAAHPRDHRRPCACGDPRQQRRHGRRRCTAQRTRHAHRAVRAVT